MNNNCPECRQRKVVQILKLSMDISTIGRDMISVDVHYNGRFFDFVSVIISNYDLSVSAVVYRVNFIDSLSDEMTVDQIIHVLKQIRLAVKAGRVELAI